MVSSDDRDFLVERLETALGADPRGRLAAVLPPACIQKIRIQDLPLAYAIEAIDVCLGDKWNNAPSWLSLLLRLLPDDAKVVAIRQNIEAPRIEADPTLASVLASDLPFLDRVDLRQKVKALTIERARRPILVVKGSRQSGKSFTEVYINHLYLTGSPIDYCVIKFPPGSGLTLGPEQVAKQILESAGVDLNRLSPAFFQNTTNNARWPYDLALSTLNASTGIGNQYWILLDGFAGADLREDTRKFVDGLCESISGSTVLGRKFRLLLLGFERTALTVKPSLVDIEEIHPPGQTHVTECVSAIFDRFAQPRPDVAPLVTRIMDGLPQDDTQMLELHKRLVDLIDTVREQANV